MIRHRIADAVASSASSASRVVDAAAESNGVVGECFWDGAASTLFRVDPANELTAALFVQVVPFDRAGLHKKVRDAVYGAWAPAAGGGR